MGIGYLLVHENQKSRIVSVHLQAQQDPGAQTRWDSVSLCFFFFFLYWLLLWAKLHSPSNSYVDVLTPQLSQTMTVFCDEVFKEVIKVKMRSYGWAL